MNQFEFDAGYKRNLPLWSQIRAAIRGKQGAIELLSLNEKYFTLTLPSYRTTEDNYNTVSKRKEDYLARGRFFNATGRTHDAYLGMVGAKPAEVELPKQLEAMQDNIDGEGSSLNDLALELTSETLITARTGVLVEPANLAGGTVAQAMSQTPRLVAYQAEQIKRHVVQGGQLVMVELVELVWRAKDDDYELVEQTRRLELIEGVYQSRTRIDDKWSKPVVPTIAGKSIPFIPFQFIGAENNKPSYDRPVMFDLAHQNLGHFMLDCDNRENLHYHAQAATFFFVEDTDTVESSNPNGIDVGAKGLNILGKDDRVEILQIDATGALPSEMLRDEQRMVMLGAQMVQDSPTNQTLGGEMIEANAAMSQLKRIVINVSAGLTQCLEWAALFAGVKGEVSAKLNDQFSTDNMTAQDVQATFTAVQGGLLPDSVLLEVAQKAGYTSKTADELTNELEESVQGESEEMAQLRLENEQLKQPKVSNE